MAGSWRVVAVVGFLALLGGCGPSSSGTVGLKSTASGEVVALARGCSEAFYSAVLRAGERDLVEWDLAPSAPEQEDLRWSLTSQKDDPRLTRTGSIARGDLDASKRYEVLVGTSDVSTDVGSISFTTDDLDGLTAGGVLMVDVERWTSDLDDPPLMVVPQKTFDELACDPGYLGG